MSGNNKADTQRLIKFVERLPFSEEDKKRWLEELHTNGISEDLLDEVHKKFLEFTAENLGGDWTRARDNMEITNITKQWKLSQASRNFRHTR
jgi:hypothetical protein